MGFVVSKKPAEKPWKKYDDLHFPSWFITFNIPTCSNISQKMSARSWENFTVWDLTACTPHACEDGRVFFIQAGNADRIFRYDFGCFRIYLGNLSVKCVISLKAKQPRISRTDKKTIKDPQVDPGIGKMTAPKHPFNTRSSSSEGCVEPNDM